MHPPPVASPPISTKVLLVGQAPGVKEPELQRPFAWTAGKTLFKWFESAAAEVDEARFRECVYFAAVCRCFPGKAKKGGGDRVPNLEEIANCADWMKSEFELLAPKLVFAVGKLAISQFLDFGKLTEVIGNQFRLEKFGHKFDLIPLPHPSGASTWHRMEPGKTLTKSALDLTAKHPVFSREVRTGA
ncbi:MAG: uracil-DNA glycosylase family protein [Verrucomicrobiota bacterium]